MTISNPLRTEHLVETEWLAEQIANKNPNLRIIDMRGYVRTQTEPDGYQTATYTGAPEEYALAHLPEALYLDWTTDIVDLQNPVPAQVATPEQIATTLGEKGIGDNHLVVAYDSHPASQFATRLWWVFRYYGSTQVRVLNGGWKKWVAEGRPTTAEIPEFAPTTFTPHPQPAWRKEAEQVLAEIGDPAISLLDARDEGQYTGAIRRGAFGGHIPGAKHLPREAFFTPENTFHSEERLREIIHDAGLTPEREVVAYCNGGVAATSVLFTLSMLGYTHLSNYDGSWNEWGERAELPHETA
jgi:thiosulfate/3-mercaptopyruvate sulfurtransferase